MPRFNKDYFAIALLVFFVEVIIALCIHDNFVRPYLGDVLVVILIYSFLKSFFVLPVMPTAIGVLGFACFVEFLQYIQIVDRLGLQNVNIVRVVIGTSFSWIDLIAYAAGFMAIVLAERVMLK